MFTTTTTLLLATLALVSADTNPGNYTPSTTYANGTQRTSAVTALRGTYATTCYEGSPCSASDWFYFDAASTLARLYSTGLGPYSTNTWVTNVLAAGWSSAVGDLGTGGTAPALFLDDCLDAADATRLDGTAVAPVRTGNAFGTNGFWFQGADGGMADGSEYGDLLRFVGFARGGGARGTSWLRCENVLVDGKSETGVFYKWANATTPSNCADLELSVYYSSPGSCIPTC